MNRNAVNIGKLDACGELLSRSINIHANDATKSNMTPIHPRFGSRRENMANTIPTARDAKPKICAARKDSMWSSGRTTPEPSRAGPMARTSLHHLDELRHPSGGDSGDERSEERRVGKEGR